jgi:hypothetical protein
VGVSATGLRSKNDCAARASSNLSNPVSDSVMGHDSQSHETVKFGHESHGTQN